MIFSTSSSKKSSLIGLSFPTTYISTIPPRTLNVPSTSVMGLFLYPLVTNLSINSALFTISPFLIPNFLKDKAAVKMQKLMTFSCFIIPQISVTFYLFPV